MKQKKFLANLLAFVMILSGVMGVGTVSKADPGIGRYYCCWSGFDTSKAIKLVDDKTMMVDGTNQQTVTVSVESENYGVMDTATKEMKGYLFYVPVDSGKVKLKFIMKEDGVVGIAECSENEKGGLEITMKKNGGVDTEVDYSLTHQLNNKGEWKCIFMEKSGYVWVENQDAIVAVEMKEYPNSSGDSNTPSNTPSNNPEVTRGTTAKKNQLLVVSWNDELSDRLGYVLKEYPELQDKIVYYNLGMGGSSQEYMDRVKEISKSSSSSILVALDCSITDNMFGELQFVDLKKLGIEDDYANAYDYTKQVGSYKGKQYLTTWQVCPGNFLYNGDIAEEVLGTSDPAKVQEMIKTPEKFLDVAKKMKEAGYYMTSASSLSDGDTYPGWDASFNSNREEWEALYTTMKSEGYTSGAWAWGEDWNNEMEYDMVFGVISSSWFNPWCVPQDCALYSEGQSCPGPITYTWGGSYLGVTGNKKNQDLAAKVLKALCCDEKILTNIANHTMEIPNNKVVGVQLAAKSKAKTINAADIDNLRNLYNQVALAIGKEDHISLQKALKKNSTVKVGKDTYKINDLKKTMVTYIKTSSEKSTVKIPDTVTIRGLKYKVSQVGSNALKNNKRMTKLTIGKNVTEIGKGAFQNCTKLRTVDVKSTSLKKIGANAFYGDKKLTKVTLKTTKLKTVGKNALKNTSKKLTVKVPQKQVSKYRKIFKNKGNKTVSVKK